MYDDQRRRQRLLLEAGRWSGDAGVYPSAAYSHFVELSRFGGELSFCGPSDYIKINEDRYIYSAPNANFPAPSRRT